MSTNEENQENKGYATTAQYYDLVYHDQSALDASFYLELADATAGSILELGCGTGRVALSLARRGHTVVGLDLSTAMLTIFRQKLAKEPPEVAERVTLVQESMAEYETDLRFGLILTPFRSFQHLLSVKDARACLERTARHLLPTGRFVLNLFDPKFELLAQAKAMSCWRLDHSVEQPGGAGKLLRFYLVEPDLPAQVQTVHFRYELFDAQNRLVETWIDTLYMRWWTRSEMRLLLELCGLAIEAEYGAYDKSPLDERQRELIFICRRRDTV